MKSDTNQHIQIGQPSLPYNRTSNTCRGEVFNGALLTAYLLYPPQTVFVEGYTVFTLSVCPNERTNEQKCVRNVLFP